MALQFPIPEGLNQTWGGARNWLTDLLGNIFDPNRQTQPPAFQGMQAPPQSLPEQMAGMIMEQTPAQALQSGIIGMGPMPLITKEGKTWLKNAKNIFGITDNVNKPGWILPDGKLLDLKRDYYEGLRHSDVYKAIPDYDIAGLGRDAAEPLFAKNTDSIRMSKAKDKTLFIDVYNKPTVDQYNTIEDAIFQSKDLVVGIKNSDGSYNIDKYFETPKLSDIKVFINSILAKGKK